MVKYAFQIEDILKIFKTGEIIYIYILPMIHLPQIIGTLLSEFCGKVFSLYSLKCFYIYIIVEIPNARQWLTFEVALPFAAILDCIVRTP